AIKPIKSLARNTRIIMFTTFYDSERHDRALREGASGFLLKSSELKEIVQEIRCPAPATAPKLGRVRLMDQPMARLRAAKPLTEGSPDRANRRDGKKSRSGWFNRLRSRIGLVA